MNITRHAIPVLGLALSACASTPKTYELRVTPLPENRFSFEGSTLTDHELCRALDRRLSKGPADKIVVEDPESAVTVGHVLIFGGLMAKYGVKVWIGETTFSLESDDPTPPQDVCENTKPQAP